MLSVYIYLVWMVAHKESKGIPYKQNTVQTADAKIFGYLVPQIFLKTEYYTIIWAYGQEEKKREMTSYLFPCIAQTYIPLRQTCT
jgi:hypothetical protein